MTKTLNTPLRTSSPQIDVGKRLKITVLAGGPSSEREVSLASGSAVAAALVQRGHAVTVRDIDEGNLSALEVPTDFAFIALHGAFGEDGQVQEQLARRGIAFCGSDAAASALAMNKAGTKARLMEADLPTPRYLVHHHRQDRRSWGCWKLPLVVKPVASGSSVDTFIVRDQPGLQEALERLGERYGCALVEQYVRGPELTVAVLDRTALPVCQIVTQREFYDYQAKYVDDDTTYEFDIDLPEALLHRVQEMSLHAFDCLGCRDFARVDWMIDEATMQPFLLEINTIPGFTSHSLLPKAAKRVGIGFEELCDRIVRLGMERES
ncbi:MAG: D-alanine--D-alanine ligase [Phycisphaerae bacterium]